MVSKTRVPEAPLQAILYADTSTRDFHPITLERPKVLLPLAGLPLIDYSLSWLKSEGIQEVFVFSRSHSQQIIEYLDRSHWSSSPNFTVKVMESKNCISAGHALRDTIYGDFVLVSGDLMTNFPLKDAILEHKERRKKDCDALMTMVLNYDPEPTDKTLMGFDSKRERLICFSEDDDVYLNSLLHFALEEHRKAGYYTHHSLQDCHVDICSPDVLLPLFTDSFDFPRQRRNFVKGILADDIRGYKIYIYEVARRYVAARISNFRSYATVSTAIIERRKLPFVPEAIGGFPIVVGDEVHHPGTDENIDFSSTIGPFTVVGEGATIGLNTNISNSFIGNGCKIGSNATIEGCYIWDDVTVNDGCELRHSIICDGAILKHGAVLQPGVVLSFKVVVGNQFSVPAYSIVSKLQQPATEDSDEESEYAGNIWGTVDSPPQLGDEGAGYIWPVPLGGHDAKWMRKNSVAPVGDGLEAYPNPGDFDQYPGDANFDEEVEQTLRRAIAENIKVDDLIDEMKLIRSVCF